MDLVVPHTFYLSFIKQAQQIDLNRKRIDFQGFINMIQLLSQSLGLDLVSVKLLAIYNKLNNNQGAVQLKSLEMVQNYLKIISYESTFRKLYKNFFQNQIISSQPKQEQKFKHNSFKALILLLKQAQIFPGLISKTSITNLYNYTLEFYDRLQVIQQGKVFTFVKFLNVMARLPNFLSTMTQNFSDNMNQIFQKLISRNFIHIQTKNNYIPIKNPYQIDTSHVIQCSSPKHRDLTPVRKKKISNQKYRPTLLSELNSTPKGLHYFAALYSPTRQNLQHSVGKNKGYFQSNKGCIQQIQSIFKHYAQSEGQYRQRMNFTQAKKVVADNRKLFLNSQFDLDLILSSASKGKSSLDIKEFQNFLVMLHQKSMRSTKLQKFIQTLLETCDNQLSNQLKTSIAAMRFIQQDEVVCRLMQLIHKSLRNSIQRYVQKDRLLQQDVKRYLKETNIFPSYLSVKKLHQFFMLLQKNGSISIDAFVKLLALCSQNIKLEGQPLAYRLKFVFQIILHSKGFSNSIKFASNKGQLQSIYSQLSIILNDNYENI